MILCNDWLVALDKEIVNLNNKIQNYTKQQNEAIEIDNFEEADRLETIIKQLHENVSFLSKIYMLIDY